MGKLDGVFPVILPWFPCYARNGSLLFAIGNIAKNPMNAALLDDAGVFQRAFLRFSLYFSLLLRKFVSETGSIATASATTQSCANGDFPVQCESPRTGGDLCTHFVSAICGLDCRERFGVFVSALENCVSRRRRPVLVPESQITGFLREATRTKLSHRSANPCGTD
jgi:hypothetical protein